MVPDGPNRLTRSEQKRMTRRLLSSWILVTNDSEDDVTNCPSDNTTTIIYERCERQVFMVITSVFTVIADPEIYLASFPTGQENQPLI